MPLKLKVPEGAPARSSPAAIRRYNPECVCMGACAHIHTRQSVNISLYPGVRAVLLLQAGREADLTSHEIPRQPVANPDLGPEQLARPTSPPEPLGSLTPHSWPPGVSMHPHLQQSPRSILQCTFCMLIQAYKIGKPRAPASGNDPLGSEALGPTGLSSPTQPSCLPLLHLCSSGVSSVCSQETPTPPAVSDTHVTPWVSPRPYPSTQLPCSRCAFDCVARLGSVTIGVP